MKNTFQIWLAIFGLLFVTGCNPSGSKKPPVGKPEETWQFWESFNQAATSGIGAEALSEGSTPQKIQPALLVAIMGDISSGEIARGKAISNLPVLNVDPDLCIYAVKYAKARMELAGALQDYVAFTAQQERTTDLSAFGVGVLLNLLKRSSEKEDGILFRAMIDQAKETAGNLQALKEPAMKIEANVSAIRRSIIGLQAEEMELRVKLAQRFGKEFPPQSTYLAKAQNSKRKLTPPNENQIAQTLIGNRIQKPFDEWNFEDLREFRTLKILSTTPIGGNQVEFIILTDQKGIRSGRERTFKLHLKYQAVVTRWMLTELNWLE